MTEPATPPDPKVLEGLRCLQAGDLARARRLFEDVLAANPADVNARHFLGLTFLQAGDAESAVAQITQAVALKPGAATMLSNLGSAHFARENFDAAIAAFTQALALQPDLATLHFNLANAYFASHRRDEAAVHYQKACARDPAHTEALGLSVYCSALACAWSDTAARAALIAAARAGSYAGPPFILHGLLDDPAAHLGASRRYAAQRTQVSAPLPPSPHTPHPRIRVAYVSRDFGQSAVAHLIAGLLEDHDRTRFEIYAVAFGPNDGSALRARLERAVDEFIDVHTLSDEAAARAIRTREIDIAVDLNGHTAGNRLRIFAYRPAPLQVSYLGFGGTTGCDFMDYVIVDPVTVPADQQAFYTEKLFPLQECLFPSDARRTTAGPTPRRQDCGLPAEGFVFCNFNNTYKITPEMFAVWMRLLARIPGSVLWLAGGNAAAERNLGAEAAARGIDPRRLVFAPKLAMSAHLARYAVADLFLDTFPYNAGTTATDALSMGLPLLTLSGHTYPSRMAGSVLHAAGLDELIATTPDAYEQRALHLATHPEALARLKAALASKPLFDAGRHRRSIEAAYIEMMKAM